MSSSSDVLPNDLWYAVGSKLDSFWDRRNFRMVCKSWRSLLPPPRHPPCVLLDESVGRDETPPRQHLMCLGKQQVYKLDFPGRCVGSQGSWLLTVDANRKIRLTNLFSRVETHTFPDDIITEEFDGFEKIVLSSPLCDGGSCGAVGIYDDGDLLAVARPGDTSWTSFPTDKGYFIDDIIFHRQKFYAVDMSGNLMVCDIGDNLHPPTLSCIAEVEEEDREKYEHGYSSDYCLAEWLGELLVIHFITPYIEIDDNTIGGGNIKRINVYMLDHTNMEINELESLGEHSLFAGINSACVSVLASDYLGLAMKNCIYFMEPKHKSDKVLFDVRVYDMEDKSFRTFYEGLGGRYRSSLPVWIIPSQTNNDVNTKNT